MDRDPKIEYVRILKIEIGSVDPTLVLIHCPDPWIAESNTAIVTLIE